MSSLRPAHLLVLLTFPFTAGACRTLTAEERSLRADWSSVADRPAITTSFADTSTTIVLPDAFGDDRRFRSLRSLPHNADGSVSLRPGFFESTIRSYCLHAGTAGPTRGDGYLYAPLKGRSTALINHVLARSYLQPQIPQSEVQTLIWAILADTKVSQLAPPVQFAAARLLSPAEIVELDAGGLASLEDEALQRALSTAPQSVRDALQFENQMRGLLTNAATSYAELERLAVRPPLGLSVASVPSGRWSWHPGGYYARYKPSDYRSVLVQIYVPAAAPAQTGEDERRGMTLATFVDGAPSVATFAGDVAVPANTGSQRLALSNLSTGDVPAMPAPAEPPPPCDQRAEDYPALNYGVPWGSLSTYDGHRPSWDISSQAPGQKAQADEPVFLSLRPSIRMEYINNQGGTAISGIGTAQLLGATVHPEPWKGSPRPDGRPGDSYGDVVGVDVQYSYTRADGSSGVLTFYVEYVHLVTPEFPPLSDDGKPSGIPMPCSGLGPKMTNGKKLSPSELAERPLVGFEGATQTPHVHVQARLADGASSSPLKGPVLVDPTIVLDGDH